MARGRSGAEGLLTVLGAVNEDTTLFVERFAEVGEEVPVLKVEEGPGGKGANVAVAAARILGRHRVAFLGAVGHDAAARSLRAGLEREGVLEGGVAVHPHAPTGHAYVVVDAAGRKSIHTAFGANAELSAKDLARAPVRSVLASSSAIVIMDVPTEAAVSAAETGETSGSLVVYSPGVRSSEGLSEAARVLRSAHSLVLNEGEARKLAGESDPGEAATSLARRFPGLAVVITSGAAGSAVCSQATATAVGPFDLGRLGLKPVNSTGSGDAFLAAYATSLMGGCTPVEAARWGNLAGALKAASPETRGSPTGAELRRALSAFERPRAPQPG